VSQLLFVARLCVTRSRRHFDVIGPHSGQRGEQVVTVGNSYCGTTSVGPGEIAEQFKHPR
jgi:hypothetical protein